MKILRLILAALLATLPLSLRAQQMSTWAQGFNKSVNSASARAYLEINTNGGGVSSFSADPLAGLFGVTVTTPTTTPHLSFQLQLQSPGLVFASPVGGTGPPSFRALVSSDLPAGSGGTVTSFSSGNLSPLFTTSVGTPTTTPALSYTLSSQSQNAVFAGPTSGSGLPTFRSLVAGDIPTLSQYLLSITNSAWATTPTDISMVGSSNAPIAGIKGLRAGGNVTLTDNGTSVTISAANSGGGASGIDLSQTNVAPFDGATNYYVDFTYPAQVFNPTGAIYFNYATNWGLANTSRVVNVWVPATNYYRHVYYIGTSTNWQEAHQSISGIPTGYGAKFYFQVFGQGDSNVVFTARVDDYPISTNYTLTVGGFNPTNSQGGCVLWLEGSNGKYSEELTNTTPAPFGQPVRWWNDLSLFVPRMTNAGLSSAIYNANPNNVPGNIPSLNWTPSPATGADTLSSPTFSVVAQPNWAFIVWYGRPGRFVFLDGNAEGNRFGCALGEGGIVTQIYAGTSLNAPTPQSPIYEWRIFSFCENSTTSIIRTNGVLAVQGNAGTQAPTRWVVGSDYNGANFEGFGYLAELLVYHSNLTTVQITNVENYLKFKYGVKVP